MLRNFFLTVILLTGGCLLQAQNREYVIVVHGGAGDVAGLESDPVRSAQYYAALDSALSIGDRILATGGEGPQAVMAVINYFENNPLFNAGKGATCTADGTFELDASIMEGKDLSAGAVAGVKTIKNPINAAYAVKTKTPHVMLSGTGADLFAAEQGLEQVDNMYFATPKTMKWIDKLKQESKKNGTVGCVVLDKQGNLTAGTSTGGMFKKKWGRIGDSPVIGAGTYADNQSCAVSCTGHGEYFIRHAVAFNLCARYKFLKEPVEEAADYIINVELNANEGNGGLIAVDKDGNIAMPFNSTGMFRGYLYKEKGGAAKEKKVGIGKTMVSIAE
ncbi:isoaspartyl peptidase/L-asparaginase family protein [Parabacteroides timonensis]|uniref:isoaspartyl peptidase/L-asparaginase family protein n=1 Tax=Parabacteroides timonensis TaxID=1871013 RepID=UPI00094E8B07